MSGTPTPIVNSRQLLFERRQVLAWINSKPVTIVLQRPTRGASGLGGYVDHDPVDVPAQVFRLTSFRRRISHQDKVAPEGDIISLSHVLTGRHDADVRPGDYFTSGGTRYEVASLQIDRSVRTACELTVLEVKNFA